MRREERRAQVGAHARDVHDEAVRRRLDGVELAGGGLLGKERPLARQDGDAAAAAVASGRGSAAAAARGRDLVEERGAGPPLLGDRGRERRAVLPAQRALVVDDARRHASWVLALQQQRCVDAAQRSSPGRRARGAVCARSLIRFLTVLLGCTARCRGL